MQGSQSGWIGVISFVRYKKLSSKMLNIYHINTHGTRLMSVVCTHATSTTSVLLQRTGPCVKQFIRCINHFSQTSDIPFYNIIVVYCFQYFYSRQSEIDLCWRVCSSCANTKSFGTETTVNMILLLSSCICLCPTTCENVIRTPSY